MIGWSDRPTGERRRLSVWLALIAAGLTVAVVVGTLSVRARVEPVPPDGEVAAAAASAVSALMTFAPADTTRRRDEVAAHLTGVLAADYALRGPDVVFTSAVESDVTMTVDVTDAAAVTRSDRSARVMVFADQTIVVGAHADTPSHTGVARWAWMRRVDGRWLLAKLEPVTPQ
ncbi:hypothetical protein nbrc107696_03120 [Gordonia spumicola]|uniref:Mce-associated membrane protein n=1 Tax=Gordonia spumicola TaxID=589161 RepID=A0A7I9V378_9ACTN|nr:hypothetical protein [Gordonia spumicola]GED99865.1 hypothetical protein nbrc107696_03120 [Gordonia spumicola]